MLAVKLIAAWMTNGTSSVFSSHGERNGYYGLQHDGSY